MFSSRHSRRLLFAVLACGLITGAVLQGSRHIYDSTEGRYCLVAREMLESGNWLEPTLLGRPHWTKPPLTYWAIAAAMRLFGRNEWAVRLPNTFFFAASCMAIAGIGMILWGQMEGFLAGLVYASSVYPAVVANTVNTDTLLTMWVLLAFWAFLAMLRGKKAAVYFFWLFLGMGFFTKGPPALIPVPAGILFLVARRRWQDLRRWFSPVPLALFLVTALWWYLLEIWRHPGLLRYFLGDEVWGRVAANEFARHPQWYAPLTVYGPCLLLGAGPWSVYLGSALLQLQSRTGRIWRETIRRDDSLLFLICWFFPALAIFSVSSSRMHNYVLPLYGAIALIIGRELTSRVSTSTGSSRARRTAKAIAVFSLAAVVAARAAPLFTEPRRDMGALYRIVSPLEQDADAVVLYRERKCFGLSFYAQKPVWRCHYGDAARDPVCDCGSLLRSALRSARVLVFVSSREAQTELEVFVDSSGFRILDRRSSPHWHALKALRVRP